MASQLSMNPWTGIWVRTRETIRAITAANPNYGMIFLYFIYGLPMLFQFAQEYAWGDKYGLGGIFVVCLVVATLLGFIMINIGAVLIHWTGKWIGGTASFKEVRAAVAWANVPNVVNILIWLLNIATFGSRIFKMGFLDTPFAGSELLVVFFSAVVQVVIAVWSFIIILKALSEVQGYSMWKAFFNMLIPIVVIFAVLAILGWLGSMMSGGTQAMK